MNFRFPTLLAAATAIAVAAMPMRMAAAETPDGTVVIAGGIDVTQLNPLYVTTIIPDRSLTDHIFDTLAISGVDGQMHPWLAESWTLIDDLTWEFRLRPGITFSNGEPVTAEGVKLFIETVKNPETRSSGASSFAPVEEIEIIDDLTFRIHTAQPWPLAMVVMAGVSPLPVQYFTEVGLEAYSANPIGTGAYTLVERVRDSRVVLEANDDYWGGPQRWQQIIYRPIPEAASRVSALLAGEIDLALDVPPELTVMLEGGRNGVALRETLTGRVFMLLINTQGEGYETQSRDVREAIAYGIDRQAIVGDILQGYGTPAVWGAQGFFGANPDDQALPYDIDRVRELLTAAGYPDGIDITLSTPAGRYLKDREVAEALAGQLTAAGIRTTVQTAEWGLLLQQIFAKETTELTLFAFGTAVRDPDAINFAILASTGPYNQGAGDAQLDEMIAAARREMDPDTRAGMLLAQQAYQNEIFPLIYVAQLPLLAGVSSKIEDWVLRGDERIYFLQNDQLGPETGVNPAP